LLESEGTRIERANIRNSGTKKLIELEFAGTGSQGLQDFYPEALEECTIHYGEITVTRNIVRIPVTPSGPHVRFDRITGLAVIGGKAYEAAARIRGDSR
jgi:hypothetical protein